ncbi:alpha-N-acetylneuraminide alpha-2,8-sialyltransferase [Callorhinchus milii]|uniref:Alpha-N-acetylneuraminide alpha-2,8-sialyltransferase n=1 Tax=Callorhinchus milii TaxID=7868 RepID=A3KLD8_CALMI|nr:alpha-N-acetylneuraminide alpha-2,8-sialyltransferase [Callorhinchus milii]CAM35868.1 alpha2,8-sialyltransferase ST8Sia I [Callorhinchus milii]|eukprot:gi/632959200/ref/XP_007895483.1/ PREDICTED: alpha-N-acetylneuraminide alpha-2,8-sialyltransferase [Callorhinchus milii]
MNRDSALPPRSVFCFTTMWSIWKCYRSRLPVGAALCVFVLCWLYVFPVYRIPDQKEIVNDVLHQPVWRRNQTATTAFRRLLENCCETKRMFAVTQHNSPMGKNLWFDGEFLHSLSVNNEMFAMFPQDTPFQIPLKKCSVVGNGGILKRSACGDKIDKADFVMRCNLPPLSNEYARDVGHRTQLVTANPSIIKKRYQNLMWSRKAFVESMKVYGRSYIYMPGFSMKAGTEPSFRTYYTLSDVNANQTIIFANPDFLRNVQKFWKGKGVHAKRLSTGLFLVSVALGLCEEVTLYGFWPFSTDLEERTISHHYYDNVMPDTSYHAMPEEFLQLWLLHKSGILKIHVGKCGQIPM